MTERVRRSRPEEAPAPHANGRDKVKLTCTRDQYLELSKACFDARESATTIKVSKEALRTLLFDHSKIIEKFGAELVGYL